MAEKHVVMSDEEERTAAGALFKIWEKQFRRRRRRRRRYPTRLDSHFRSLVALTNWMRSRRSLVSQALRVLVPFPPSLYAHVEL